MVQYISCLMVFLTCVQNDHVEVIWQTLLSPCYCSKCNGKDITKSLWTNFVDVFLDYPQILWQAYKDSLILSSKISKINASLNRIFYIIGKCKFYLLNTGQLGCSTFLFLVKLYYPDFPWIDAQILLAVLAREAYKGQLA